MAQRFYTQNFETEVLNSREPVLVDFYADWCGPCKMMGPVVEELASLYHGRARVGKLNVDESAEIARQFNVMSIPTFILFQDGRAIDSVTGAVPAQRLQEMLDHAVA